VSLIKTYRSPHVEQSRGDTSYAYNKDGQLDKILRPDGTASEFIYDGGGRLSAVTGPGGQARFGYDPKTAHLTAITATDGGLLTHTYDGSLLTKATWTGAIQGTVSLTYNSRLLTASTSVNGEPPIKLEYDPDGLMTQAGGLNVRPDPTHGLLAGTVLGKLATAQEYNGFGEVKVLRAAFKDREVFAERYERDALGRIVRKTEAIDGQTRAYVYTYDGAGRLIDVTTDGTRTGHYEYDANGNRMTYVGLNGTVKASYDAQDRVSQYGKATYVYTANGEWLSKTVEGKTTTYSYDLFGNLKAASLPDGTKIDYVVDGGNRRIGKRVDGKLVQGFLYQDQLKVIAELDGENQVVARFVYASRFNVPDYMTKGGKTYRILTDLLGSPRTVVDAATGAIAQRIDYDEFGTVLRDTNPGFQPFGFAGGIYDQQTKLTRFGARDYDAFTGKWTSTESIPFGAGDTNLYNYALNDPVNLIDSNGLAPYKSPVGPWGTVISGNAAWGIGTVGAVGGFTGATLTSGLLTFGTFGFGLGTLADKAITWANGGESLGELKADYDFSFNYAGPGGKLGDPSGFNWICPRGPWCNVSLPGEGNSCPPGTVYTYSTILTPIRSAYCVPCNLAGQQLDPSTGKCECPKGFAWNALTQKCECALSCDTKATLYESLDPAACKCVCDECCEKSRKAGMAVCGGQSR